MGAFLVGIALFGGLLLLGQGAGPLALLVGVACDALGHKAGHGMKGGGIAGGSSLADEGHEGVLR